MEGLVRDEQAEHKDRPNEHNTTEEVNKESSSGDNAPREPEEPFLRFRLTYLDTVQSSPASLPPAPSATDRSTPFIPARRIPFVPSGSNIQADRIPELRIFGATEAGQRCCIHVHGALPYVYVEYEGKVAPDEVHTYINRLARAINACMAASLNRRDPSKSLFVAFIVPVKGVPFYGFHVGYRYYLKIYTLDPKFMTRMVTLLRSGEIMKKKFIVYEAHIPFHLQFMLDFNLYGCGWVDISKAKFREPVPEDPEQTASNETDETESSFGMPLPAQYSGTDEEPIKRPRKPKRYTRSKIPPSMLYARPEHSPPRVAHSELEFDIHVSWILNRHLVKERNMHADFTEYLKHPIPDDFKFVHSVRELWEDEKRRRQMKGLQGPFEVSENSAEELLGGLSAGTRSNADDRMYGIGTQPPWMAHNQNVERFHDLVEKDGIAYASNHPTNPIPDFETFVKGEKKGGWMEKIRTSFQSVEALFEETLERDELDCNPFGAWAVRGIGVSVAAKEAMSRANSVGVEDVNPQYLALLATQAGRARLAQLEAENEAVEEEDQGEVFDASGIDQDVIVPSDEEETVEQEDARQIQELAKHNVEKRSMSRKEALDEAQKEHKRRESPENDDALDAEVLKDMPPGAQGPATSRESSVKTDMSRSDSKDSTSTKDSADSADQESSSDSDTPVDVNDLHQQQEPSAEEGDPDVMLLDQLIPLDFVEAEGNEMHSVKEEEDEENGDEPMLDNSPPTPPGSSRTTQRRSGLISSDGQLVRSTDKHDLVRAGLGDLSHVDLSSNGLVSSSPLRQLNGNGTDIPLSPGAGRSKTPGPWIHSTPFARKQSTPSPNKKPGVSPNKANYFSPVKSKLRNAVVNPTFVGEAKLKRKREDDLIGFRAIGDHGRTTLQRMLDVQTKPRLNGKIKLVESGKHPLKGLKKVKGIVNGELVIPRKKRKLPSPDDVFGSSSTDGSPALPMHVLLSSADAGSQMPDDSIHVELPSWSGPQELQPGDHLKARVTGSPDIPLVAVEGRGAEEEDSFTPTQVIPTQPLEQNQAQLAPMNNALASQPNLIVTRAMPSDAGTEKLGVPAPVIKRKGVRFQSEVEYRATSPLIIQAIADADDNKNIIINTMSDETLTTQVPPIDTQPAPALDDSDRHNFLNTLPATSSQSLQARGQSLQFYTPLAKTSLIFARPAPTLFELLRSLDDHKLPHKLYRDAYWSNLADLPQHAFEYAGRRYTHQGDANMHLQDFEAAVANFRPLKPVRHHVSAVTGFRGWNLAQAAPSRSAVQEAYRVTAADKKELGQRPQQPFVKSKKRVLDTQWHARSQIQGPTQANPFGAKYAQVKPSNAVMKEKEHMSALAIELHINTRGDLLADPAQDPMAAIFYCLQTENDGISSNGRKEGQHCGIIAVQDPNSSEDNTDFRKLGLSRYPIEVVEDEIDLIKTLVDKVHEWDPEIFTGYDVLKDSWGYFVERVDEIAPELDIIMELSRVRSQSTGKRGSKAEDRWGYSKGATLKVTGRHILPVWRLLKSDVNLCLYSLENVVFHILRQRVPRFSSATLTSWFTSKVPVHIARVLQYHILRAQLVIELLEEAEIVSRNAEFARVFGVDFYSVLTRGSQFKVESVMFKITKPENFMLPSPSREDVGKQNAAECIPLILEPQSGFYSSPVLVFDFQSLYPSVMIAYNLCYSTCLGRLKEFLGTNRLGTSSLAVAPGTLTLLKDLVTLSPNGLMFLKPQVRRSMLSKMLTEILDTRVMIKKSMKLVDEVDRALVKLLNARQLGLKFIANVTYGYTSATFSGRMPCVEIADAIVQTGRETLERAKNTIQSRPDWGAIVRYGDTDSLFVHLPGKTKDEAFKIGNEIADTITRTNPKPIKLKFEKVYLPSFLLAKKRYVGFKYESESQKEPEFDAKGIETVRRDGFPAMQKILETSIKIMFRTSDLSSVKHYVQQQYVRIMQNRSSPQDFIYAKEVKMGSYSDKITPPPGAVVTARRMLVDPRTEALYGERVPYIISRGIDGPKAKQAARALTPEEFLSDGENALDDLHYIGRIVKTLNRLFFLVGVDTQEWWNSAPRRKTLGKSGKSDRVNRIRVDQHFGSLACPICGSRKPIHERLCEACSSDNLGTTLAVAQRIKQVERRDHDVRSVCATCASVAVGETDACDSIDCPVLYSRVKACRELDTTLKALGDLSISENTPADNAKEPIYLVV